MAIIPKGPPTYPGPSNRGVAMIDTYRGVPRVRVWPRRRPLKPGSRKEYTAKLFAAANRLMKVIWGPIFAENWQLTKDTPFYPRDIMLMCAYGRAFVIIKPDGKRLWSMAARRDVSLSLDVLSATPGLLLIRGDKFWEGFDLYSLDNISALLDEITTTPGKTVARGATQWEEADLVTGSPGYIACVSPRSTANASATATMGHGFIPQEDFTISQFGACVSASAGETYKATLCAVDGSHKITAIWQGSQVTPSSAHDQWLTGDANVTLTAGQEYVLGLTRTDGTDTSVPHWTYGAKERWTAPLYYTGLFSLAKKAPAVNDTFTFASENAAQMSVMFKNIL